MNTARRMRLAEYVERWDIKTLRRFSWENVKKREYLENVEGIWANVIKMECREI
jgi:hypothetical protein